MRAEQLGISSIPIGCPRRSGGMMHVNQTLATLAIMIFKRTAMGFLHCACRGQLTKAGLHSLVLETWSCRWYHHTRITVVSVSAMQFLAISSFSQLSKRSRRIV
jgi:hypothetical protein